jgi:hypothetical protein
LANKLHSIYPHISPENISLYKFGNGYKIYLDDILKFKFERAYEHADATIEQYPLFLQNDAYLLMY